MIHNPVLKPEVEVTEWFPEDDQDIRCREYILFQTFGETSHTDTLTFVILQYPNEQLYCGLLKSTDGFLKAIIPAIYQKTESDGLDWYLEYSGLYLESYVEEVDARMRREERDGNLDGYAMRFVFPQ